MTAPYQAVLLAAGRGSRLGEETGDVPKSLLPIGPRSSKDPTETCFLRRQCELLRSLGVEQIVVVVGYRKERMREAIAKWDLGIVTAENTTPNIMRSGSLHSFQFATLSEHGVLDGTKQCLLMDADIVYDKRLLAPLLGSPEENTILVYGRTAGDEEEVRVFGSHETPRFLGKGLSGDLVGDEPCLGEAVGIVKFAPKDHDLVRRTMGWFLGDPTAPEDSQRHGGFGGARQATEHEELTQRFMHYRRMRAVVIDPSIPFMEVDNAKEYAYLREELYPRILREEEKA